MANLYRELFTAPGTKGFALAGLLARIPLPMTGIGIITMLSQLRGSIPALAAAVLVAGLFFAPTIIVAMSLVERLVPEHLLTEGMT